ncbi:methyltransferase [Conexibacter woesei]|uniref:Methyltransferase small n=1 Tax=Conexibacter woesei (strain DSM 14684 / CCUG 47730 / CIP 108061 / JCM 11494 / NBRC 100937 / ID131577) TaxID=469383 RepID=D3F864_CONWI|nr:methyltransferase [Conexibacter woesei]ADB48934.1 methyltransferase small [Conexibacter woesei DSM 14684]
MRADPDAALLLRSVLDEGHYREVQALLSDPSTERPFVEPFSGERVRAAIEGLPELGQLLVRLFTLGATVPLDAVHAELDASVVDRLLDAGLLERTRDGVRSRFIVVAYANRLLAVTPPLWLRGYEPGELLVDISATAFWMARFVANRGPARRALELGTGSGLLVSLLDAAEAVAVEGEPGTAEVATFNVLLNGLDERVEVRAGKLFEPVADEQFDLIVANPPCLPAPHGVALPPPSDGGEDGDAVLRQVLAGVGEHLEFGGEALVGGQGFGGEREPFIAGWLRDALAGTALGATVLIGDAQSVESAGETLRQRWQETGVEEEQAFAAWARFCADARPDRHYTYLIKLAPGGDGTVAVHPLLRA